MKSRCIWRISVTTTDQAEDSVGELIARVFDSPPSSYYDFRTRSARISIYLPKQPKRLRLRLKELREGLKVIRGLGLELGSGRISVTTLAQQNWAESWKRHFPPLEIGSRLLIKPSWSRKQPRKGQAVLVLDPGLTFGTGRHPTTEFCLRELARRRNMAGRQSFLDIGTGSGILAIAAAKLGYSPIEAFDFDPDAVSIARENARLNSVASRVRIGRRDLTRLSIKSPKRYDLVCANLLANLLISEHRKIIARLKPGGVLAVAGILEAEFDQVQECLNSAGLQLIHSRRKRGWCSGSFTRHQYPAGRWHDLRGK